MKTALFLSQGLDVDESSAEGSSEGTQSFEKEIWCFDDAV